MILIFYGALVALFIASALGSVLSFRLRRHNFRLFEDLDRPPANTWHPLWVFRLLNISKFKLLDRVSRVIAVIAIANETIGIGGVLLFVLMIALE